MKTDKELEEETIRIIENGGRIILKKDNWYISCWTNIAAGIDFCHLGKKNVALEFFNLKWALTIAPLYDAEVVVVYDEKEVVIPPL